MSPSASPNLDLLVRAARALGPLRDRVAFLGGATTVLLLTDAAAPAVRPTLDVDVIADVPGRADYYQLEDQLRALGFRQRMIEGEPICRWHLGDIILDVMPTAPEILGFSNRWYAEALRSAAWRTVGAGLDIRLVTAPHFLATKLEALRGRGAGDFLASRDLEDIVTLVDGREELAAEVRAASAALKDYVRDTLAALLASPRFLEAIPAHLPPDEPSQRRSGLVLARMRQLGQWQ
jgi:predicted nucleotidyltransferase